MNVDTWAHISPPLYHVTLMSIRRLALSHADQCRNKLEVYDGSQDSDSRIWKMCPTIQVPPPSVFHARIVSVHFKETTEGRFEGLQLAFTHHLVRI